jgi:two-component system sensor histidine kinase KdpD
MAAGEGAVLIVVEDDGPGIAPADLERVFDRFYQADRGVAARRGLGLGLAIVAELLRAMGGRVRAESPTGTGGGTRMVVELRRWSGP